MGPKVMAVIMLVVYLTIVGGLFIPQALENFNKYSGEEEFDTLAQAQAFQSELIDYGDSLGVEVDVEVNSDNSVKYSAIYDGEFAYGEKLWVGLSIILLVIIGVGTLVILFLYLRVLLPIPTKKVKTVTSSALKDTTIKPVNSKVNLKSLPYAPQVVDKIVIPQDTSGIIGVRTWAVTDDGKLASVSWHTVWKEKAVMADKKPDKNNDNGIYAYRLGLYGMPLTMLGLVSLTGRCMLGQDEGIIRAERCDIITLIYGGMENKARLISARYGVPVVVVDGLPLAYIKWWLITNDGIHWLKHNEELITSLTKQQNALDEKQVEGQIAEILEKKKF